MKGKPGKNKKEKSESDSTIWGKVGGQISKRFPMKGDKGSETRRAKAIQSLHTKKNE